MKKYLVMVVTTMDKNAVGNNFGDTFTNFRYYGKYERIIESSRRR